MSGKASKPKGPIILLASPGQTSGGYFIRTKRLLDYFYALSPEQTFLLVTPHGDPLAKVDLPPTVRPHETIFLRKSVLLRTLWIQCILPFLCQKKKAAALLGMGCYGPRWAPCDSFILINNARLISPLFFKLPGLPFFRTRVFALLQRYFLGQALKGAKRIGVQRSGLIEEVQRLWKIPSHSFVLVPNSSSLPDDRPVLERHLRLRQLFPGKTSFLFPSLYARHKNYELLIPALEQLRLKNPEAAEKVVIGLTMDERSKGHESGGRDLIGKIRRSPAAPSFCLMGEVPHASMRALFSEADCILYPSAIDSFSVIFLDAMSCGLPIVAADLNHAREICGEAAEYFAWNDPDSLASALERLALDEKRRAELIEKGQERIRLFPLSKEMEGMKDLIGMT